MNVLNIILVFQLRLQSKGLVYNEKSLEFLLGYTPTYRKTMMYCFGKCQGISTKEG